MTQQDVWNPSPIQSNPLFQPLLPGILPLLSGMSWPDLTAFNQICRERNLQHSNGLAIQCVAQSEKSSCFEQQYEPRIFLKGELQTRLHNWHDFFNLAVWLTFSKSKSAMNTLQYRSMKQRDVSHSKRTDIENVLTLFDENGTIVLSSDPSLLDLLCEFQWHELFYMRRQDVIQSMRFLILGHSSYEKAISPYIGLTTKSILIETDERTLQQSSSHLIQQVDELVAQFITTQELNHPDQLQPLPILGIPNWDERNIEESFYHNQDYFRSSRRRTKVFRASL